MKRFILIAVYVLIACVLYYLLLPPINLTSPAFWAFAIILLIIFIGMMFFDTISNMVMKKRFYKIDKVLTNLVLAVFGIIGVILVINIIISPLFNAKGYSERITVDETHTFIDDVKEVDFSQIPLIDKDSSEKLGDRKMGEFTTWVSQFYVSDIYTQINYNNEIVRVTPIEYAGFIKYLTNRNEGIKGYIMVDSITGTASLKTLDKGMKYMPSAYFFENLNRKLRLKYPTVIFDEPSFEIDNEGNPYWIVPTIKYSGVGMKREINGAVILDPITGESKKYDIDSIPTWVDHVYSADLIIEQIDDWGEYRNGFLNSMFGQKDVINTTEGYNYLVMDDDVYLYTGITSVSSDESNLGFVLVNLRTKKTNYYLVPGAEEFSAMASAEGLVQEKGYEASFPLLINLNNRPTYLLSLKDDAGLVKMYAFVDVEDYQRVVVSDASLGIENAKEKYLTENPYVDNSKILKKDITIKSITSAVIDGNTYYYITDSDNALYYVDIKVNRYLLPFLKANDKLTVSYSENDVNKITELNRK